MGHLSRARRIGTDSERCVMDPLRAAPRPMRKITGVTVSASDLTSATAAMRGALQGAVHEDWTVPAGDLNWSCRDTGGHIADDLFSYASQVIARPARGYLPIEAVLEPRATPK